MVETASDVPDRRSGCEPVVYTDDLSGSSYVGFGQGQPGQRVGVLGTWTGSASRAQDVCRYPATSNIEVRPCTSTCFAIFVQNVDDAGFKGVGMSSASKVADFQRRNLA